MPCSVRELYDWHARPGAIERLVPPWQSVRVARRTPGRDSPFIGNGARVEFETRVGPVALPWIAEHFGHEEGRRFCDRQLRGPFACWEHTHEFLPADDGGSTLRDSVDYDLRGGPLGGLAAGRSIRAMLDRMFWFRHERTRMDLERHAAGPAPMTVAIAGSSGDIGVALAAFLSTGGHRVIRLVRRPPEREPIDGLEQRHWNPAAMTLAASALDGVDAVVNLCGASIADGRWTLARKNELTESRLKPTGLLARTIAGLPVASRPVLLNASGAHVYGEGGDEPFDEAAPPGDGFLAALVRDWERAARPAELAGVRVVHLRFGAVLSARGGALRKLLLPTRLFAGGPLGGGRQWWPWIGLDDALAAVLHCLADDSMHGPVNICAAHAATANDIAQAVGRALRRPAVLGVPPAALRVAVGREFADEALLASTRAEPGVLQRSGFRWSRPTVERAVGWELGVRRMVEDSAASS